MRVSGRRLRRIHTFDQKSEPLDYELIPMTANLPLLREYPRGPLKLSRHIPELDGIRGAAIGMVVFYHYLVETAVVQRGSLSWYLLVPARLGWTGVDFFFVLSGFLIGGILLDARNARNYFPVFYARRFFRIVPIYAIFLFSLLLLTTLERAAVLPQWPWITRDALPWYSYLFLVQNFWMGLTNSLSSPAATITWSLAVEEQFYLTFPVLVRFLSGKRLLQVVLEMIFLTPLVRAGLYLLKPNLSQAWFVLMPCRADALLFGVLVAIAIRNASWKDWLERHRKLLLLSIVLLLVVIPLATHMYYVAYGLETASLGLTAIAALYALVLAYVLIFPRSILGWFLRLKALTWLGSIAYGVYLFHQAILYLTFGLVFSRPPTISSVREFFACVVAFGLTVTLCRLSWRFIEKPLIDVGHHLSYDAVVFPARHTASSITLSTDMPGR